MSTCPSAPELSALSRRTLSAEENARLQQHVEGCPACYAQLLRGDEHDTGELETGAIGGQPEWLRRELATELNWPPGLDLGRYVILQTLGKGGMGVVFRAYDKELDRAVALKVLHQSDEEGSTSGGSARLLREAQAMARLSHPNVVAVHDVVVLQRRVCVVMELVEGRTVREWLFESPRPGWREILAAFRAAGEGLAAAHDAHLIHRDFKPDNVLVGQDGRIRVTDFGIARLAKEDGAEPALPLPPAATPPVNLPTAALTELQSLGGGTLRASITTQDGRVVGTPRYMAPEQLQKAPADFRTDQYAFAVSLYEALHGQHPFPGKGVAEWFEAARHGEVRAPPAGSHVPAWVHRILLRALSSDPAKRYGSLRELTQALGADPAQRRSRRLMAAGVATAVTLALVAAVATVRSRAQLCSGASAKLAGVWDGARRERMHAAFAATQLPFAEDSFTRAAEVLDGYTSEWARVHQESCEATRIRGDQSDGLLTLRMTCLQNRLDAVGAATELFSRADAALVGKVKATLDGLPRLAACSDVAALTAKLPPPEDPQIAAEVQRLRTELTRARVLVEAGRVQEAAQLATPVLEAAAKTGYSPVLAEAELLSGMVVASQGKVDEAMRLFTAAFRHGLADGYDELLAAASVRMAAMNVRKRNDERVQEWASFSESVNLRARDAESAVLVHNARGNLARNSGDFASAAQHFQRAADEARARLGPENMNTLGTTYNTASALQNQGRFREASGRYATVLEAARRTLGPRHPFVAYPLVGSGLVAEFRGDLESARRFFQEVIDVTGGHGTNADNGYEGLATVAIEQGRYEDALLNLKEAQRVHEEIMPGRVEALGPLAIIGLVKLEQGKRDEAWKIFEDVIARGSKLEGAYDSLADAKRGEARILLERGQPAKALPLAEAAVGHLTSTRGKSHPWTLEARLQVAKIQRALGRLEEARIAAQAALDEALVEFDETHLLARQAKALLVTQDVAQVRQIR